MWRCANALFWCVHPNQHDRRRNPPYRPGFHDRDRSCRHRQFVTAESGRRRIPYSRSPPGQDSLIVIAKSTTATSTHMPCEKRRHGNGRGGERRRSRTLFHADRNRHCARWSASPRNAIQGERMGAGPALALLALCLPVFATVSAPNARFRLQLKIGALRTNTFRP